MNPRYDALVAARKAELEIGCTDCGKPEGYTTIAQHHAGPKGTTIICRACYSRRVKDPSHPMFGKKDP